MNRTTVAVDLAKDVFEIAIARKGRLEQRRRLTRRHFEQFVDHLEPGTHVVLEACGTAHYWGRRCRARGAIVRLMPAHYVRPYVRRNKTDRTDAEALLEADRCSGITPVPVKTAEQQAWQSLHRVRAQWQRTRVARINGIRALLREHGLTVAKGAPRLQPRVMALLEAHAAELPAIVPALVADLFEDVRLLTQRITHIDRQLQQLARTHPVAARLQELPGLGPLAATALVASVPHIHAFARARRFASWLGLTPREYSTGSRRSYGGISKRGDRYLRWLLVHGARSVLQAAQLRIRKGLPITRLQTWGLRVRDRRGPNRAAIAVANKLGRIIWAVWTRDIEGRRVINPADVLA